LGPHLAPYYFQRCRTKAYPHAIPATSGFAPRNISPWKMIESERCQNPAPSADTPVMT
jgi:hypothetical protein